MRPSIPVGSPSTSEVVMICATHPHRTGAGRSGAWLLLLSARVLRAAARRLRRRRNRGRRRPPTRLARQQQGGRGVLQDQGGAAARGLRRLRARRHHPGGDRPADGRGRVLQVLPRGDARGPPRRPGLGERHGPTRLRLARGEEGRHRVHVDPGLPAHAAPGGPGRQRVVPRLHPRRHRDAPRAPASQRRPT